VADGVGYLSCLWLLCAALLLPAADSLAGKRAYGEDFVRVGQRWTDAGPPPALNRETPPPGADGGFLRQIEQLQDREGPYSDSLAEPLAGLGRYYRSAGDLDGALRSYRRALHVVRINDGLYSERQIPILQELLDTYRGSGDLQALDQRYDYYFRLYGNGQPPYSEVRLRATLGYLRWQREAIRLGMDGERHRRLLALYHMNDTLIQATGQDPAVSRQQHREVVLSQLRNL
jgi:tetratricopeptide (TPR) repeat protein